MNRKSNLDSLSMIQLLHMSTCTPMRENYTSKGVNRKMYKLQSNFFTEKSLQK